MSDLISRQDAIGEIEYEIEMINSALDSITLDFNARERLYQKRGEAREILNSIQVLPSAQSEPQWIPVSERLPEESDDYLVTIYFESYGIHETDYAFFNLEKSEWSFHGRYDEYFLDENKLTAWMPLPKPYMDNEEKKKNEQSD